MGRYRIEILKKQQFTTFFNVLRKGLYYQCGNVFVNASRILDTGENWTENNCLALGLLHLFPETFEDECSPRVSEREVLFEISNWIEVLCF